MSGVSFKSVFKHMFKTEGFRKLICFLAAQYIRLVYYTSRKHYRFDPRAEPFMSGKAQAVFAFWHGRLLMMPMIKPKTRKMQVLISTHRDGEMIARTMHHFGFGTLRGSTTRGGADAAKKSIRALQAGESLSVTPDGPKGPACKVQAGIVTIARLAKLPVVPVTFSATRYRRAKTWDQFLVALPFSTIYFAIGAPLLASTPEKLEAEMIRLTQEVDDAAGVI